MKKRIEVTVNTTTKDLYRFMLYHAYSKLSGMITLIFGIGSLIVLPIAYFSWHDNLVSIVLLLVVFMYLILTPINMLSQAKRQVMGNPVFKNPITFVITRKQFEAKQYTGNLTLLWGQLYKVAMTRKNYLFYVNDQQAFVMPKDSVAEDDIEALNQLLELAKEEVPKEPTWKDRLLGKKDLQQERGQQLERQLMEMAERDAKETNGDEKEDVETKTELKTTHGDEQSKIDDNDKANEDKV